MSRRNKSTKRSSKADVTYLNNIINVNGIVASEGPAPKKWTLHDLKNIKAITTNQNIMFQSFFNGQHICALGFPGTGKTFCAIYLAFTELLNPDSPINHIKILRSIVPTREMGHLPGSLAEKTAVYEMPYTNICTELFGKTATWDNMKQQDLTSFESTSYLRGLTWDDTIVIVDECQNLTWHELNTVSTRLGINSRLMLIGDVNQDDLNKKTSDVSGMAKALNICIKMEEFDVVNFVETDIVRSAFVKSWIVAANS